MTKAGHVNVLMFSLNKKKKKKKMRMHNIKA